MQLCKTNNKISTFHEGQLFHVAKKPGKFLKDKKLETR